MENQVNNLMIDLKEQRIKSRNRKIRYSLAGLAVIGMIAGVAWVARDIYRGYSQLRKEADTALATGNVDVAQDVLRKSDVVDLGCLSRSYVQRLQRMIKEEERERELMVADPDNYSPLNPNFAKTGHVRLPPAPYFHR
jgi:hypothetical protein